MIHYNTWNQYTTEIPLHRLTKEVTHNIDQRASLIPGRNPLRRIDIEWESHQISIKEETTNWSRRKKATNHWICWDGMHLEYHVWFTMTNEVNIPVCREAKHATQNMQQPVFVCATSNLMKNNVFLQSNAHVWSITSLFLQHQAS